MVPEIAALVLYGIVILELFEKPYLLEYVLPLFHRLLAQIGHLLDSHDLLGLHEPGVINRPEAPMADLPQILEYFLWIVLLEQIGYLRILEATRPRWHRHYLAVAVLLLAATGRPPMAGAGSHLAPATLVLVQL